MSITLEIQAEQFTSISEWLAQLQRQNSEWQAIGWEFLGTLRDGISQFGRSNDKALMELYDLASQATGIGIKRLQNLVSMARNEVAEIAQEYELDFGYAEAVLGLPAEEADYILSEAKAKAKTVSQVRRDAWVAKQPVPTGGNSFDADEEPPYADNAQYDYVLPDAYDADAWFAVSRNPIEAAQVLRQQFDAGELATLIAELIR